MSGHDYRKHSRAPGVTGGPSYHQVFPGALGAWVAFPGALGAWVARDAWDSRGALGVSSFYGT